MKKKKRKVVNCLAKDSTNPTRDLIKSSPEMQSLENVKAMIRMGKETRVVINIQHGPSMTVIKFKVKLLD